MTEKVGGISGAILTRISLVGMKGAARVKVWVKGGEGI